MNGTLLIAAVMMFAEPANRVREWKDVRGNVFTAKFVRLKDSTVYMQRGNKVYSISLQSLSASDQEFIAELLGKEPPGKESPDSENLSFEAEKGPDSTPRSPLAARPSNDRTPAPATFATPDHIPDLNDRNAAAPPAGGMPRSPPIPRASLVPGAFPVPPEGGPPGFENRPRTAGEMAFQGIPYPQVERPVPSSSAPSIAAPATAAPATVAPGKPQREIENNAAQSDDQPTWSGPKKCSKCGRVLQFADRECPDCQTQRNEIMPTLSHSMLTILIAIAAAAGSSLLAFLGRIFPS